jgi:hypothetical protein
MADQALRDFERAVHQSIYDGHLLDLKDIRVNTIEEVEDILRSWSVASDMFDAPWKCDWPL